MIRFINDADFKSANKLLKELNYEISKASFNNPFFNAMCYFERDLIGVLVFKELYERIEIEYIVVDKVNRSRKVASKLMDFLIGYAHNKQIENISLEVNVNNLKAINLKEVSTKLCNIESPCIVKNIMILDLIHSILE